MVAQLREALLKMPEDAVVLMESGGGLSLVADSILLGNREQERRPK
jgi:hypothetical protein